MKPNFEPFAHTARDLVERDITLYETPTSQNRRQGMFKSSKEDYQEDIVSEAKIFLQNLNTSNICFSGLSELPL